MTGYNRRDFMKLLAASGLSLAVPSALTAEEAPLILKPIPSSGEKLPVIGLGTSRVFEVGPGELEREGPREVLRTLAGGAILWLAAGLVVPSLMS